MGFLCAIGDGQAGAASTLRHLQIMASVAHHQRPLGAHPKMRHEFLEHLRVGFALGLIGGASRVKAIFQRG